MEIGLAMYSLLKELEVDYRGTLEKVAAMGIKHIELCTTPNGPDGSPVASPAQIGQWIKELGLNVTSNHCPMSPGDDLDAIVQMNLEMGSPAVVLPFAVMGTVEHARAIADLCARMGEKCKAAGLKFYYHNHAQEFLPIEGIPALDWLAREVGPELMDFELDLFWIERAGRNCIDVLKQYGSRCTIIHQKDKSADAQPGDIMAGFEGPYDFQSIIGFMFQHFKPTDIVPVGMGVMDVEGICKTGNELGHAKYIIIELDSVNTGTEDAFETPLSPLESVRYSLETLRKYA